MSLAPLLSHGGRCASPPCAAPNQTVFTFGHGRFTFITDSLVRLEWSPHALFDDRNTLTVINRASSPPPRATMTQLNATAVEVVGDSLTITFDDASGAVFDAGSLRVVAETDAGRVEWAPGAVQRNNLNGTYTSLDCYGDAPMDCIQQYEQRGANGPGWTFGLQPGLLARDGWTLLNDTATLRVEPSNITDFPWWSNSSTDAADLYFSAYGTDFRGALRDFAKLMGAPGLPPRANLGVWYSRYYRYSDETLQSEVIDGFKDAAVPLSLVSLDLDWHTEPTAPNCSSWGQLDFNSTLFPDPADFISGLHAQGLGLTVNVHLQGGTDACAQRYEEFVEEYHWRGPTNGTIACAMDDPRWVKTLYNVYLRQAPLQALDFLWPDYSGCGGASSPFATSSQHDIETMQLWSTYVLANMMRASGARPYVLSRHGGLGNHKWPALFSGDTFQHEGILSWETRNTASAANVLVGVSHDIGGNHFGSRCQPPGTGDGECAGASNRANYTSSEMFLRWVQFGVFTAVFRTHCDHCSRSPWLFPFHSTELADAYRLREALVPYLYTAMRVSVDTGVVPVHPVYYDAPALEPAYAFDAQYMFGDDIAVAPVSEMVGNASATVTMWAPPGAWTRWDGATSTPIVGPTTYSSAYAASQIPLLVRAGATIPLKDPLLDGSEAMPDLTWVVWPTMGAGRDLDAFVYEDDGVSLDFERGIGAFTRAHVSSAASRVTVTVDAVDGTFRGIRTSRAQAIQLRGVPPAVTSVDVNGVALAKCDTDCAVGWWRVNDGNSLLSPAGAIVARAGLRAVAEATTFTCEW
jgi:alpha-glucosidase (family GH31 glycosyl hydrolase)